MNLESSNTAVLTPREDAERAAKKSRAGFPAPTRPVETQRQTVKLTDYVAAFLAEKGVKHAFGLTGGAVVHMFDSLQRQGKIKTVFHHHEQAAAFAAEAASSYRGVPDVCVVTTGPGGTNTITGLLGAWLNSIPCFFISGQARLEHLSRGTKVRQRGTQEFDILSVVSPMVKNAVTLQHPNRIRYELERLWHLATTGRTGPVWLDLPLNFQWAEIDPTKLEGFTPPPAEQPRAAKVGADWATLQSLVAKAKFPLVLLGNGVRLAGATDAFRAFVRKHKLPVVTTWSSADLVPYGEERAIGRIGMAGQRGANMAVNNCDLLLAIGTHLPVPVTGSSREQFARKAQIVVVNVDVEEIDNIEIKLRLGFAMDAGAFLAEADRKLSAHIRPTSEKWLGLCREYQKLNDYFYHWSDDTGPISHYRYMKVLSRAMTSRDDLVIDGGGTSNFICYQSFENKAGQRMILSSGLCSMGSGLPEAIGVAAAKSAGNTVLICGDGSFQFNIQELQTILQHRMPVKIFIAANNGYLSIRGTQDAFLAGRHAGSAFDGGISLPDYVRVAQAYGIPAQEISSNASLEEKVRHALASDGPFLTVVQVDDREEINPRQQFSAFEGGFRATALDDMAPAIPRELYNRLTVSHED